MGKRRAALARMELVVERAKAKQARVERAASPMAPAAEIATPAPVQLSPYNQLRVGPTVDYGSVYRTRIKQLGDDGLKEEPRLRALEAVVNLYRSHHPNADVDTAKAAVLAAIKEAAP